MNPHLSKTSLLPEEDVTSFPAEETLEAVSVPVTVICGGVAVASTIEASRIIQRDRSPIYFIPMKDVEHALIAEADQVSIDDRGNVIICYDIVVGDKVYWSAAWRYLSPPANFAEIGSFLSFRPDRVDACIVGNLVAQTRGGQAVDEWNTPNLTGLLPPPAQPAL